jgi:hypothetical protein
MKPAHAAFTLCLMLSPLANAEDFPETWMEFKYSTNPQNKKAAEAVEKEMKANVFKACAEWGKGLRAKTETRAHAARNAYLLNANEINGLDIGNAREKDVVVGMTACGVYAAYGVPTRSNTTQTVRGFSAQHVYSARSAYVYTEMDGAGKLLVKAIQRR